MDGVAYPVCDRLCRELLETDPVRVLGPRVRLAVRPDCADCRRAKQIWQQVARRRPVRLQVVALSASETQCPQLWIEGAPEPEAAALRDPDALLSWLALHFPGYQGCC
ncbi:hypothetical protein ABUL39_05370 [Rhodothermus marinus]|uniref:hypothetical protein n=1 Tax=Rhodothermus marinus TaxID=29549 RepID=UPI0037C664F8